MPRNATESFGTRTYRTPNGHIVPSVTTILGCLDKPWMGPWAAKLAATYAVDNWQAWAEMDREDAIRAIKGAPFRRRDEAGKHGTEVHEIAEAVATEAPFTIPDRLIPHRDAILGWHELYRPRVLAVEQQVCREPREGDPHGWAGTFDLLATVHGLPTLIDVKTAKEFDGRWTLQLAGYVAAPRMFRDKEAWPWPAEVRRVGVLHIPSDRPEAWTYSDRALTGADMAAWMGLVRLYGYLAETKADHGFRVVVPQEAA